MHTFIYLFFGVFFHLTSSILHTAFHKKEKKRGQTDKIYEYHGLFTFVYIGIPESRIITAAPPPPKQYRSAAREIAYQFGTVGSCPTEFLFFLGGE